ncbi:hybrid sensor histidine kinase/response regulator transcription factor [Saccharicrinis aurantiacus]|uniref:hybrid sensor histidine kinase/response regulator transcription factor n=1 Tax=Saccharicrinis aurantiacus TaxID=1849719 RepID=UPI000838177E|nr:two-component regulator propeller domain-containing protein [Saccharicrinis aurantiacus]
MLVVIKEIKCVFIVIVVLFSISIKHVTALSTLTPNTHITISDGLSHNGVTEVFKDSRGYLWMATYQGLNRYNGYDFKVYRNTPENSFLLSNRVRTISEDKNGNLWLGTDEGVTIYNYTTEQFLNIYSEHFYWKGVDGPIVRKVLIGSNDLVYCVTEKKGILVFDLNYELVDHIKTKDLQQENHIFTDALLWNDNTILLACNSGLISYNYETNKLSLLSIPQVDLPNALAKCNDLLVVTLVSGYAILEGEKQPSNLRVVAVRDQEKQYNTVSIDKKENIWLGSTRFGIKKINNIHHIINKEPLIVSTYRPKNQLVKVSSFYVNDESDCWVATFNKGVFRFGFEKNPFCYYHTNMGLKHSITSNNVLSMEALDNRRALLIANYGGAGIFNTTSEKFEPFPYVFNNGHSASLSAVEILKNKEKWFGLSGSYGIYRVNPGAKKAHKIEHESSPDFSETTCRSFAEDANGDIWMACLDNIFRVRLNNRREVVKVESIHSITKFKDKNVRMGRYVYYDSLKDIIWVGTDTHGLFRIKVDKTKAFSELDVQQFTVDKSKLNSLSSNFVTCVTRTKSGELWVGTEEGGICRVNEDGEDVNFTMYTENDGLSNNVVKSIVCDQEDNLWVATNIGLNKYDKKSQTFRVFRKEDGLPFDVFDFAHVVLPNGNIVLSGQEGFCYFDPTKVTELESLPRLELIDLKLNNKDVNAGDTINGRVIIKERLNRLKELKLFHDENVFSLSMNAMHYSNPDSYYLRYKLEPVNSDWVTVSSRKRNISYSGLPPGKYTLKVQASNVYKDWTEAHVLSIEIIPPWWKSYWAIALYIVVLILVVILVFRIRFYTLNLKHTIELDQLEKDNIKTVSDAKFKFFTNVSHEFKTPLTLISGPIDLLLRKYKDDKDSIDKLNLVKRQSKKMSQLVDQVHDFQRADKNLLQMHKEVFSFKKFIVDVVKDFEHLASENGKTLILKGQGNYYVAADKGMLEKIVNNLLNNAFKFTSEGDTVEVNYEVIENKLKLSVTDTGKGIDPEDIDYVFERFYQSKKKHSAYIGGSGIGLAYTKRLVEMHYGFINVKSTLGKGSVFTVKLPILSEKPQQNITQTEQFILEIERQNTNNTLLIDDEFDFSSIVLGEESKNALVYFAEDNDEMRSFTEDSLSHYFKVKSFVNGQQCVEAMETEWPDIVLSDVLMPELNGFELCKIIKSDIKTSHIPVVLLTACTASNDKLDGLKTGADGYITKPFDLKYLISTIENILSGRKSLRERYQSDFPLALEKKLVGTSDNVFLEKLYTLMTENIDNQDLDLDSFARELYLNRTHFYQKVKQLTNQTPFDLLKSYRLKKAAELLISGNLTVTEVCEQTGFKSRTHFSKIFKQRYGVTPSKYPPKE